MSPIPNALRRHVAARAKERCGYCQTQARVIGMPLEIEHIIPEVLGGDSTESNLWLACPSCNRHKGRTVQGVDKETGITASLFNPIYQVWHEHFEWDKEGLYIVGLTPTGRITVEVLHMNNPFIVHARQAWITVGWHPPHD
jgi:hypothetical protein